MLSLTMAMTSLGGALSVSAAEESQKTITHGNVIFLGKSGNF